jgi:murein L,D-transpeptidase YafK
MSGIRILVLGLIPCAVSLAAVAVVPSGAGAAPHRAGGSVRSAFARIDRSHVSLRIVKSKLALTLLVSGRPLKTYPVVLGRNPVDDKRFEGDGCTPEGEFRIVEMRSPHRWSRFMLLSYPNAASRRRFQAAQRAGRLPAGATIGGAIGIHGVPAGFDRAIDAHQNWTAGCISLKTADIDEIYSLCRIGTPVRIVH